MLVAQSHGRTACAIWAAVIEIGPLRPDEVTENPAKSASKRLALLKLNNANTCCPWRGKPLLIRVGSPTQRRKRPFDLQATQGGTSRNGQESGRLRDEA